MARKFSLKDNPIFQRLEIPKPRALEARSSSTAVVEEYDTAREEVTPSPEEEEKNIRFRPSKLDPQISTPTTKPVNSEENKGDSDPALQEDEITTSLEARQRKDQEENVVGRDSMISDATSGFEDHILTLKNEPSNKGRQSETLEEHLTQARSSTDRRSTDQSVDSTESEHNQIEENNISQQNERSRRNEIPPKFEPQNLSLKKNTPTVFGSRKKSAERRVSKSVVRNVATNTGSSDLREAFDKSLFFGFYNEMNDELLPQLDAAEQILYSRLFRLSYGFNRNYCTVSQPVLKEKTGLSRNTIRTGLQSLVQKEWVRIAGAGNHVTTTYRIVLPRERNRGANLDPQKEAFKNRHSISAPQNLSRKDRSSENDTAEDQKIEVQNLTGNEEKTSLSKENNPLDHGGSEVEPQKSGTSTITNNTLTLSSREIRNSAYEDNKLAAAAARLVTLFYSQLGQQPSSAKQSKGVAECVQLFSDGFSEEQVEYGINWLLARHPGTGAFSRVAHFIDQALKEKQGELHDFSVQEKKRMADEQERLTEQRLTEQGKQIEEIKASLDPEELTVLNEEAAQLVECEHGALKFGRETLTQIKLSELIRVRYLKEDDS